MSATAPTDDQDRPGHDPVHPDVAPDAADAVVDAAPDGPPDVAAAVSETGAEDPGRTVPAGGGGWSTAGGGGPYPAGESGSEGIWDDGVIARRAPEPKSADGGAAEEGLARLVEAVGPARGGGYEGTVRGERSRPPAGGYDLAGPYGRGYRHEYGPGGQGHGGYSRVLRVRLEALRELVGLSRTRLDGRTLAEAGRVLEEAAARHRLSLDHTVVALAGASGSGKSTLFNALAGAPISEAGVRRPTTAAPIACTWSEGADGLLDRLGIPPRLRRRPPRAYETALRGLVLIDLPDHDSAVVGHRDQVDRMLGLVDAVVWVVDPEKYADAVLHERYLRPLVGYAEVTFVVLNQIDRLPGDTADQVLDDLRRLLDEDGIALGEHGEPGAVVLALSALTGEGVSELRETLGQFSAQRGVAERRLAADVTGAAERLRPVYLADGRVGLTEGAREEFEDRLADAVGAVAAGHAAEREWLRQAESACGQPWAQLRQWYESRRGTGLPLRAPVRQAGSGERREEAGELEPSAARAMVDQAVRAVADNAAAGLPEAWARTLCEAATQGAEPLSDALDAVAAAQLSGTKRPVRPRWWSVAAVVQGLLLVLQIVGALWLVAAVVGGPDAQWWQAALLMGIGVVGGPVVAWCCRVAARGPARRYGQEAERRLRGAAAACGRARVLEPVAAELLRYREVRDQYLLAAGSPTRL